MPAKTIWLRDIGEQDIFEVCYPKITYITLTKGPIFALWAILILYI